MIKIACFTATRAEYGLLKPILKALCASGEFSVSLIVSGTHLDNTFGYTSEEIRIDGISSCIKLPMNYSDDTAKGNVGRSATVLTGLAGILPELSADAMLILGDRYETLAVAQACCMMNIPVLHLHGGELSYGSQDNQFRHAISKLSHVHLCATKESRKRLMKMGESPDRIFLVGAPGVENCRHQPLTDLNILIRDLHINWQPVNILFTYHPDSLSPEKSERELDEILSALEKIPDLGIIMTYPNADSGHKAIIRKIREFQSRHPERVSLHKSLGTQRYLTLIKAVDAVVGNSSSGIIEAPSMGTKTLNIGNRQRGRERALSVIDSEPVEKEILAALNAILSSGNSSFSNPYDWGDTSINVLNVLKELDFPALLEKDFYE
ncbi:MAG: UDP-N-acetylglucosamine 2-epimerase [Saccharospirillaceae bacterium]|nr:UDP-N-acetylglucosamine 2-epimerase [Saccharospirillaceae bacterium]MCD8530956.1 UDP-N-acetylglucosamine 2-epimerase [Saccharospirillaceae bacterium]